MEDDSICKECKNTKPNPTCEYSVDKIIGACSGRDIKEIDVTGTRYKVMNDTYYSKETSDQIISLLDHLRKMQSRVRFYWGDTKTGCDWGDTCDVSGRISRTTGTIKIPILIHNRRSSGGCAILTHCIVRIDWANKKGYDNPTIYRHPKYHVENTDVISPNIKYTYKRSTDHALGREVKTNER
jgi:hypothetical protein